MTKTITVYFATNRKPILRRRAGKDVIVDFDSELGPIDGTSVRFGSADAAIGADGEATAVKDSLFVADEKLLVPQGREPLLGSRTIFDQVRDDMMKGGRPTLVLIHGFSNTFFDTIERGARILSFYGLDANIFAFSWPSRGRSTGVPLPYADYVHDRDMARRSGMAMARTLRILYRYIDRLARRERCNQPIHLLCHSMGNYAFRHAVQALMRMAPDQPDPVAGQPLLISVPTDTQPDPNNLRLTFNEIVLAAADEDDDAFDDPAELQYLPRLGRRVTVYHTELDWILSTLSQVTKFNGPRLGMNGPDNMSTISDKVTAVDVSAALELLEDPQNHQYYRIFPRVRDDIVAVLSGQRQDEISRRDRAADARYRLQQ